MEETQPKWSTGKSRNPVLEVGDKVLLKPNVIYTKKNETKRGFKKTLYFHIPQD